MTLTLDNVSFAYTPGRDVVRHVSVAPRAGALTAVLGPNGSGKSTLLRIAAGLIRPRGRAMIDGRTAASLPEPARAGRVAHVPQVFDAAYGFTVREVVAMGRFAARAGPRADERSVSVALRRVGLGDRAADAFNTLSAGQRQRAVLARALAQADISPSCALVADEPVSALDPGHALRVLALLRDEAARGRVVVAALHDLGLARRFADDALVLARDGSVWSSGPAAEVIAPGRLDGVYDVVFEDSATASGIRSLVAVRAVDRGPPSRAEPAMDTAPPARPADRDPSGHQGARGHVQGGREAGAAGPDPPG